MKKCAICNGDVGNGLIAHRACAEELAAERGALEKALKSRDEWKYEAKCEHDNAVGFMGELEKARRRIDLLEGAIERQNTTIAYLSNNGRDEAE